MQMAFYFDQTRCIDCSTCVVACKDHNQLNPGLVNWRKTMETEVGDMHETDGQIFMDGLGTYYMSMSCNHCDEPACIPVCGAGAISKSASTGIVLVDRAKCQSLKTCIDACPYGAPKLASNRQEPKKHTNWMTDHPMQKCTFCIDRIQKGDQPACVEACIARALDCGDINDLMAKYPDAVRAPSTSIIGFPESTTVTGPNFLVKPKK